jgi:hypothetical protein
MEAEKIARANAEARLRAERQVPGERKNRGKEEPGKGSDARCGQLHLQQKAV